MGQLDGLIVSRHSGLEINLDSEIIKLQTMMHRGGRGVQLWQLCAFLRSTTSALDKRVMGGQLESPEPTAVKTSERGSRTTKHCGGGFEQGATG